jgi:hypothetical protein
MTKARRPLIRSEVQAKLLCAKKITHAKSLLNFIRTETDPPILWQPADLNEKLEELYSVRIQSFCSFISCVEFAGAVLWFISHHKVLHIN